MREGIKFWAKFWVILVVCILMLGLAGLRLCQVTLENLVNFGQSADSPNGRYRADVTFITKESFLGNCEQYYEFAITAKADGEKINSARMLDSDDLAGITLMRGENTITWSADPAEAIFDFPKTQVRLRLRSRQTKKE